MSRPVRGLRRSERLFRVLFTLYPRAFRDTYGDDAAELFRDRYRDAYGRRGAVGVLLLWMRTVPNVLLNATLERAAASTTGAGSLAGVVVPAFRALARSPWLSATVVVTLGVGIGANVALFSVLRGVLLEPLPYPEPERLVRLWETNPEVQAGRSGPSPLNFADWERSSGSLEAMAAWYLTSHTVRTQAWVEEIRSAQVTSEFFRVLGVRPMLGRDFRREEVVSYGPVMLSHAAWQRLFRGDPGVVGQTVTSGDESYRVVGVMPPDFSFPDGSVEVWMAWDLPSTYADRPEARTWRFLEGVGRLAPEATIRDSEEEMAGIASALSEAYPESDRGWSVAVTSLRQELVGPVRGTLWAAFGAVLFILMIACANVANLLLARAPARSRDLSIRSALGADRSTLLAGLLAEGAILAGAAAILGLAIGWALLETLVSFDAGGLPRLEEVRLDGWVLAFTAGVALVTALLFGIAPALRSTDDRGGAALGPGRRAMATAGQRRTRELFVAAQVAIAMTLLAGAALFRASFDGLRDLDPGFAPSGVLTFRVSLDPSESVDTWTYYRTLLERLREVPGVLSAGAAQTLPLNPVGNDFRRPYREAGSALESADAPTVHMRIVDPGYREAIGMGLLEGGDLPASAEEGQPMVALVNRALAERLWPSGGAVGEFVELDFRDGWQPHAVVGVLEDVRHYGPREEARPEIFLSLRQVPYLAMSVVVRTGVAPASLADVVRGVVSSQVPVQPAYDFVTMDALRARTVAKERFLAVLFGVLSLISLVLATSGVYGVVAYAVSHQRRAVGVKMALGATDVIVVRGVVRWAGTLALAGLGAGVLVVVGLSRVLAKLLYGVPAYDPATLTPVAALLLTVAVVAAYVPARRAGRVPPVEALRAED